MSLIKGVGIVFFFSVLSRGFGFLREVLVSYYFGVSSIADALILGLTPLVLAAGILGTNYAQVSMVALGEGGAESNTDLESLLLAPLLILSGLIGLIVFLFSDQIISILGPGLSGKDFILASLVVKWTSPAIFFSSISFFYSGVLNLKFHFLRVSFAALFPNLGVLFGLFFYKDFGPYAFSFLVVLGYFAFFSIVFLKKPIKKISKIYLFHDLQISFYKKYFISLMTTVVVYIDLTMDRGVASQLVIGSVAALNYASKFVQLPNYTIFLAISTVFFPLLIKNKSDWVSFRQKAIQLYCYTFIIAFLVTFFIYFFSEAIIKLIFLNGSFDENAVKLTSNFLKCYSLGFVGYAFVLVGIKISYASDDFMTPLYAGIIAIFFKVFLNFVLVDYCGVYGLALATSFSALVNGFFIFLFFYLRSHE